MQKSIFRHIFPLLNRQSFESRFVPANKELSNLKDKLIENRTELQGFSDDLSASGESSPELDKIHFQLSEIDNLLLSPGENLINFINSDALTQTREELVSLIDAGELTQDQLVSI